MDPADTLLSAGRCRTVAFMAPRTDRYKEFLKGGGGYPAAKLFMPIWSYNEIMQLRDISDTYSHLKDYTVKELFNRWGGVPRYVLFYADNYSQQQELYYATQKCSRLPLTAVEQMSPFDTNDQFADKVN
jgi:hypothetical protein